MHAGDKTVQIRVRLSPDQAARLDSHTHDRGITRSEYIRKAIEVQLTADEDLRRTLAKARERG